MARLTRRHYGAWAGVMAAIILNLSAYHTAAVGAFASARRPALFFWLLTLDRLSAALEASGIPEAVDRCGVSWGCALLEVPRGLPAGGGLALHALLAVGRQWLRRPGPYLAVIVGRDRFQPGTRLERIARMVVVRVPGGAGDRSTAFALTPCSARSVAGNLSVPLDLAIFAGHALSEGARLVRGPPPKPISSCFASRSSAGDISRRIVCSPRLAALDPRGLPRRDAHARRRLGRELAG